MSASVGHQWLHEKNGVFHYEFDKITNPEICSEISSECDKNAYYEKMKSIALFVSAIVLTCLLGDTLLTAISAYGFFRPLAAFMIFTVAANRYFNTDIFPLNKMIEWSSQCSANANHYAKQSFLAKTRKIELLERNPGI